MKKYVALTLALLLSGVLAYGAFAAEEDKKEETTEAAETAEEEAEETEEADADEEVKLETPMIVTTCGQSPGAVMMSMVAMQAGLTSSYDNALSADTFEAGDLKTLVVTTGTSGKGMGAAGTDVDKEIERCTALIEKAREAGLTIVCAHIEGMARRTDSSDQASIDSILPLGDIIVALEDSDSDGIFSDYAKEHDVPIILVKDALSLGEYMK